MATATLPAYAKIRELRLAVEVQSDNAFRPLNRKNPVGPRLTEMWRGDVLFADMSRANVHAFHAWLAALDGKVLPFALPFVLGFSSKAATQSGSLVSTVALGARSITVSGLGSAPVVGTMGKSGDIDTGDYHLFEVVTVTPSGANYILEIAPRMRKALASTATINLGAVNGKFRLDNDTLDGWRSGPSHGSISIPVIEAR